jgi:hypothetical protein
LYRVALRVANQPATTHFLSLTWLEQLQAKTSAKLCATLGIKDNPGMFQNVRFWLCDKE